MLKKRLRCFTNQEGAAMLLLVLVILIFSTIGLAILSLSISNYKLSLVDKKTTLSFYMAESGLEQAYEIILGNVKTALAEANVEVNVAIEAFIAAERQRMLADANYDSEYIIGDDPAGPINTEKLKEKLQTPTDPDYQIWLSQYQDKYKEVLVNNVVSDVNNQANYSAIDENVSKQKPNIKVENVSDPSFSGDNYVLTVSSLFDKEEFLEGKAVSQKVKMDFNIDVPSKISSTINENTEIEIIDDSPLFDHVFVVAAKDLIFEGYTNATIKGNCYAYGTLGDVSNLETHGGIIFQKPKNKITVNGELATYRSVHHNGKAALESQNAWLVANGNVYAEHLIINQNASNVSITVNEGDVYTSGDLLMYGKNGSRITVNNNWYGMTESSVKDAYLSPNYTSSPDNLDDLVIINGGEYKPPHLPHINNFVEMRKKQFEYSRMNNYLVDVGNIISNEVVNGEVITDEFIIIDDDEKIKGVYIVGPEVHGLALPEGIIKVKVGSNPVKGIVIAKGNIRVYGTVNFTGLLLAKQGEIQVRCEYNKNFTADPDYLRQKAYELEKIGKNPFKYNRPTGDSLPWPDEKQVTITQTAELGVGDSISLNPYKNLISVSDWQKV